MEFNVLGPLRARIGGQWVGLGAAKQRAILGLLLVNANRVVPFDRVLEEVWGRQQPEAGVRALRYQVSKLRDSLEPGRESGVGGVIGTERGGYVVRVDEGEVDAHCFERLAADGARALADGRFSAARSRAR
jgi:DNA-binding SARP family transcriptional activator